jgi:ubiquinone/menaquinone biosynthesis C-methylase UbiE
MKQAELFHPRVFDQKEWAEGYYKRNKGSIARVGRDFARLLKKSGFSSGKILDAGCGFAAVPIEIARVFPEAEIIGIDLGKPLLELGETLVEEAGLAGRITLEEGDAQDIPFETDTFDVVINTFLLHIVEDPQKMLNEIERITHPEGRILIRDLRRGFLAHLVTKFKTGYTSEEAKQVLGRSGIREGRFSNGPFWWDYMAGT